MPRSQSKAPPTVWLYHHQRKPRQVSPEKARAMREEGWVDSPTEFEPDPAADETHEPATNPVLDDEHQALLDLFREDPDQLIKSQYLELAEALGVTLDSRATNAEMIATLQEHLDHGDDQATD